MITLQDFVNKDCPVCGASYQADPKRLKHGRQTTCSRKCSYVLRGQETKNILKNRTVRQRADQHCERCGKQFQPAKDTARFCSKKCSIRSRPGWKAMESCSRCGKDFKPHTEKSKYCGRKCFEQAHREAMKGSANPAWTDGRSYYKRSYRGNDWDSIKLLAYKRDGYTCQSCGVHCIGRKELNSYNSHRLIQCHHIIFWRDSPNNSLENLVTLCASCHAKIHFGSTDINEPT